MQDLDIAVLVISCAARGLQELIRQNRSGRCVDVAIGKREKSVPLKSLIKFHRLRGKLELTTEKKPVR